MKICFLILQVIILVNGLKEVKVDISNEFTNPIDFEYG